MFPSEFATVKEKSGETWLKAYSQAVSNRAQALSPGGSNGFREKVIRNNKYVDGKQSPDIYKTKIEGENNVANLALFYDTANPLGAFVKNIVGQLQNQDYKPRLKSLSPESVTKFDEEFKRLKRIRMIYRNEDKFKEAGVDLSEYIEKEEIFQSDDEIEIHLELNLKDDAAMALTIATQYVLDLNKYPDLERRILADIVKHNWANIYVEANEDGKCIIRVPKLENMLFDYFEEEDGSDCRYRGERRSIDINTLKKIAGDQLTDKELFEAARNGDGNGAFPYSFGQLRYYPNGANMGMPWGGYKTTVFDLKIISSNEERGYEVEDKRAGGVKFVRESNMKKIPKDAKRVTRVIENQYKVKYIPAIDKIIDFGICYSPREKSNGRWVTNVENDYITFAQDIREMSTSSIVDQLIGKVDDWIFIKLNIMRMIAQAHPAGVAVDQVAVAAAANGFGEGNITPKGLIDIFTKRGVFIYSSMLHGRALPNANPIRDTPESTLASLERMQSQMVNIIKEMEIISGVPYNTIGEPDKDTLVGNNKIALSNRNNSLRNIDLAYRNVLGRMCSKIATCLQDAISNGHSIMDYGQAIGYGNIDAIKATKQIPMEEFGVMIDTTPDAQEQQNALDGLRLAIEQRMIRPSAVSFVADQIKVNPTRAIKFLAIEEKRFLEIQNESADGRSRAAAEANAAAGQAVEQAKMMTINAEWDRKDQHLTLEFRHDQGLSHQEYLQEQRLQHQKDKAKESQILLAVSSNNNEGSSYESKNIPKAAGSRMPALPDTGS